MSESSRRARCFSPRWRSNERASRVRGQRERRAQTLVHPPRGERRLGATAVRDRRGDRGQRHRCWSFCRLPVDAYPDISPPMVEIVTQWPGHAAEEVERLITVPIETEMNGLPRLKVVRSISLYGLSDVRLIFDDGTDNYFAASRCSSGCAASSCPRASTPSSRRSPRRPASSIATSSRARPAPDGAQDPPGLGAEKPTSRCPASRTLGFGGRPCSTRCCSIRPSSPAPASRRRGGDRARGQQQQRRRRILLRGRPVLLRARTRPAPRRKTSATSCSR